MSVSKKIAVTLLASFTLAACSANHEKTAEISHVKQETIGSGRLEQKTSQSGDMVKEQNANLTSHDGQAELGNEGETSSKSDTVKGTEQHFEATAIVNGDFASLVGTWVDANGNKIVISGQEDVTTTFAGVETNGYRVKVMSTENNIVYAGLTTKEGQNIAGLMLVPAGVPTPHHGAVYQEDVICSGQTTDSEISPYFKTLN